jgi:hypothetical protein
MKRVKNCCASNRPNDAEAATAANTADLLATFAQRHLDQLRIPSENVEFGAGSSQA